MSFMPDKQTTSIATHTNEDIFIRDKSLCEDLIGKVSFTEMSYFQITGRMPDASQVRMLDACLVTLMEHGLTPSALSSRLIYSSAPEAMQAAVAAGLMGVGSVFAGTMEGCAELIRRLIDSDEGLEHEADAVASEFYLSKLPLPGFGHHLHKPDDPRSLRLLSLADELKLTGKWINALKLLSKAVDKRYDKHITINATGAIAACLGDCGVSAEIMRGFALITRCAGLVGHIHEEQHKPAMRVIWENSEAAIPYDGDISEFSG
mgnify:CR=1 FL=1